MVNVLLVVIEVLFEIDCKSTIYDCANSLIFVFPWPSKQPISVLRRIFIPNPKENKALFGFAISYFWSPK
jgi:hypothetical protein